MKTVDQDDCSQAANLERLYQLKHPTQGLQALAHHMCTPTRGKLLTRVGEMLSLTAIAGACLFSIPGVQGAVPGLGAMPMAPAPVLLTGANFGPNAATAFPPFSDFTEGHDPHDPATADIVHRNMQAGHVLAEKSTITGVVDAHSMTAALYWTFALKNKTDRDKEAAITMTIPHNSVVNRATLWINGVAQEAAFASNNQVQTAYDWIVVRHRDPLLITQVGPDRIKIMAAPVTANGGTMRIRLGIVAPVQRDGEKFALTMPKIVESNLKFEGKQDVHITSDTRMTGTGTVEHKRGFVFRANVEPSALDKTRVFVNEADEEMVATRLTHTTSGQYVISHRGVDGTVLIDRVDSKPDCKLLKTEDAANRLSSLWAHQEIEKIAQTGNINAACDLANTYRIVSSVSGAVVLETDQDYAINGMNRDMYRSASNKTQNYATGMQTWLQRGGPAPVLQGATNGTIGPQAGDATIIRGINTAGTVRVNNLATVEAFTNTAIAAGNVLGLFLAIGLAAFAMCKNGLNFTFKLSKTATLVTAAGLAVMAASASTIAQWLFAAARDANFFS